MSEPFMFVLIVFAGLPTLVCIATVVDKIIQHRETMAKIRRGGK